VKVRPSEELVSRLGLSGELPHLDEALTHPSFSNEQPKGACTDNQRLELLGDSVLGLCVTEQLMKLFPIANEGELSRMRSTLVNADALASFARHADIGLALRMGRGAQSAGEHNRTNVLADAVEAIIGALYLDRGLEDARAFVHAMIAEPLARLTQAPDRTLDPKSDLQERVQAEGGSSPRYRVVHVEGPDHARAFTVVVEIGQTTVGEGHGRSKKVAEQEAARAAIQRLWGGSARGIASMTSGSTESVVLPSNEAPSGTGT